MAYRRHFHSGFYYRTESLSQYTRRVHRDLPNVSRDMAKHMGERLEFWIKKFTPVDTGRLRDSIDAGPVTYMGGRAVPRIDPRTGMRSFWRIEHYQVDVETHVEYAPFVEYDTGKYGVSGEYVIRPVRKKALAFVGRRDGKLVVVTKVMHPGSKGRHMFSRGAARLTETYIRNQVRPILSRWRLRHMNVRPI